MRYWRPWGAIADPSTSPIAAALNSRPKYVSAARLGLRRQPDNFADQVVRRVDVAALGDGNRPGTVQTGSHNVEASRRESDKSTARKIRRHERSGLLDCKRADLTDLLCNDTNVAVPIHSENPIALALRHVDGSRAIRRKRSRAAEGDLEGAFLGRRVQAPIAPARADEGRDCSIGCDSKDAVVTVFRCDDRAIREERPS